MSWSSVAKKPAAAFFRRRRTREPARALEFESESPQSVADLVFRKPGIDASCEVRGQLFVGGSPGRLETQLVWTLHDDSAAELEVDLSPGLARRSGP